MILSKLTKILHRVCYNYIMSPRCSKLNLSIPDYKEVSVLWKSNLSPTYEGKTGDIRKTRVAMVGWSGKSGLLVLRTGITHPRALHRAPRGRFPSATEPCSVIQLRVDLGRDRRGARPTSKPQGGWPRARGSS